MYRCCECGAYLDSPYESHECDDRKEPAPKRKTKQRFTSDDLPHHQMEAAELERKWREWYAC